MPNAIEEYKQFIDAIVDLKKSVVSTWVQGKGFPDTFENKKKNELLSSFSLEQKQFIANLINDAKKSGIHDVLFYLNEQQLNNNFKIVKNDIEFPIEPFGTSMHFDFIARLEKDDWPQL
jgi:hypothetical protein